MACFFPFNSRNLDASFFIFRPTIVIVDDLVEALKNFSFCTESLGCVHSAIFRSIHGNMMIWYGAWIKRSGENKDLLDAALLSMLTNVSSMAILMEHGFYDAYAGETKDHSPAAKFYTGDIVSMNSAASCSHQHDMPIEHFSYACLAIFKDRFNKMDGAVAGVCLKCQTIPKVAAIFVWKSLQCCYNYILNQDSRSVLPYFDGFSLDLKYDVFRVVYVSGDGALNFHFYPPHKMLEGKEGLYNVTQDLNRVAE
ncbi:uncharacterized protein LOC107826054 [Nicotiana tabacum]|uniref:Uncharacterized protein LOC107826054 n=1 Tax=Nicotiana tabacum TaxID=4097 RepID=A0A1S4D5D0_TOBAC|nr:uncharacterized protein LOC104095569 [Nicotiana tomentosiformis]XP_016508479.1 PREDICTED: uncharacterized protein LOC107826054 [Nicotiana tabacum]